MKKILILSFPLFLFSQQKNDWSFYMKAAMSEIIQNDFNAAIFNLNKSLELSPNNSSSLYFKAYSLLILNKNDEGCKTLADALFFNSNNARSLFAEKCSEYNPNLNIDKFKTGIFKLRILDPTLFTYNFERKNDIQYETYDGKTYSSRIQWLGNGEYTIIAEGDLNPSNFIVRVLKIEDNKYLYGKFENNQIQFGIIEKTE
ncbi:TPA: hypothetical protein ACGZ9U_000069 [Elizabethkingia anophelis]